LEHLILRFRQEWEQQQRGDKEHSDQSDFDGYVPSMVIRYRVPKAKVSV
jgi:hypothetical protein